MVLLVAAVSAPAPPPARHRSGTPSIKQEARHGRMPAAANLRCLCSFDTLARAPHAHSCHTPRMHGWLFLDRLQANALPTVRKSLHRSPRKRQRYWLPSSRLNSSQALLGHLSSNPGHAGNGQLLASLGPPPLMIATSTGPHHWPPPAASQSPSSAGHFRRLLPVLPQPPGGLPCPSPPPPPPPSPPPSASPSPSPSLVLLLLLLPPSFPPSLTLQLAASGNRT